LDAVLCAGDLFEQERFAPDTGAFLHAAFADLQPVPVFIAPGNHDWLSPQSLYRQVDWTSNVNVFSSDRLQRLDLGDGLSLWGGAHCVPANTPDFLDGFQVDGGGVHLGLFHGSELGGLAIQGEGKVPHAPFNASQIPDSGLHHAFVGHYHRPQDAEHHTYPGNPEPLVFGEQAERGAVIATVDANGIVSRERRVVRVTDVHDLVVDITGCGSNEEVRERVRASLAGLDGYARVTVTGEVSQPVDLRCADLESLSGGLGALVIHRMRLTSAYDLDTIAQEHTVRGQFVRDVRESTLDEETKRRVLVTGLRALSGRSDLEVD
jgi:DNA repair exonuclease SbcCD nuclease subunit